MAVLKNFVRSLEGGATKFDADVDNDDIPVLLDPNTDAENEFDMKI